MPQLGIALSGVAITLLIKGAGEGGEAAQHTRAQTLLCAASAAVMASLAFIDALHKPRPHCALAHSAKVIAGLVAAASTLAVYLQGDTTDLFVLLAFVAIYAALVFVQVCIDAIPSLLEWRRISTSIRARTHGADMTEQLLTIGASVPSESPLRVEHQRRCDH